MSDEGLSEEEKREIERIREKKCPEERLDTREEYEDEAIEIIESNLGSLGEEELEEIITKAQDEWKNKSSRFGNLFGPNDIFENPIDDLNSFISEVYGDEDFNAAESWIEELKYVGEGFASLLLYLKNRQKYNIMLSALTDGLKVLKPNINLSGSFKEKYETYNEEINKIRTELDIRPQEVDIIFTVLGRLDTDKFRDTVSTLELERYIDEFENLSTSTNLNYHTVGRAIHQPLLLISLIKLHRDNRIDLRKFEFTSEIGEKIEEIWNELWMPLRKIQSNPYEGEKPVLLPLYHLKSSSFWKIEGDTSSQPSSFQNASNKWDYVKVNEDLVELIEDDKKCKKLIYALLDTEKLFDLNRSEYDLNEGPIPDDLRHEFEVRDYEVDTDAKLVQEYGIWWVEEDTTREYQIDLREENLSIYNLQYFSLEEKKELESKINEGFINGIQLQQELEEYEEKEDRTLFEEIPSMETEINVWFEKTERDNHSSEEGWVFGECLASPQENERGGDIYSYMRECKRGDIVIHYLQEENKLVGISLVEDSYEEVEDPPSDMSRWSGRPGYRVPLQNFKELEEPILREDILGRVDYAKILDKIRQASAEKIKIFYDKDLNLRQGAYITKVPPTLLKIFVDNSEELKEYINKHTNYPIKKVEEINLDLLTEDIEITPSINVNQELSADIPDDVLDPTLHFHGKDAAKKIISQITAALNAGKHIILTGPPGTGKTEVARLVCKKLCEKYENLYSGYQITTATADWSTFDTVGGYMPGEEGDSELRFNAGQILRRFKDENYNQKNELLVLDEINRADIDKAFGPIFTLLSGQPVVLPFKDDGKEIKIIPVDKYPEDEELEEVPNYKYIVPKSWRIIATMNTYDKTSLYEMSYAFMRRFQFIRIEPPEIPEDADDGPEFLKPYLDKWNLEELLDESEDLLRSITDIWYRANNAVEGREIGPAIVKDMLAYLSNHDENREDNLIEAITGYIFPQLEGVPKRKEIISEIIDSDYVENDEELKKVAQDMLQVDFDNE